MDSLSQLFHWIRTWIERFAAKVSYSSAWIVSCFHRPLIRVGVMAFACGLFAGQVRAMSVSWFSNAISNDLRDSMGVSLNDTFYMQLGFFANSFTPTAGNTADWAANWRVFDQAADYAIDENDTFDPSTGYFTRDSIEIDQNGHSMSPYAQVGLNFSGQEAYLWTFNKKDPVSAGTEWFLARANDWVFPTYNPNECCPDLNKQWSVSDLATVTPVWGRQGEKLGGGTYTVTDNNYTFQTFTVVPEPSTALLTALGVAFALLRRNRRPMNAINLNVTLLTAVLAIGIASPCHAERIHWYGPTYKTNVTSTGELIDQEMVFELGLFTDGFVPTAENAAEWTTHWLAAQRANYSQEGDFFTGNFVVDQASSPFTGGQQAYIWGFRGGVGSSEWILLKKDTWKWPVLAADQAAEARNPLSALEWNAAEATAIVGALQPVSVPFLMRTASIFNAAPPKTSWNEWALIQMKDEKRNGFDQDPDGDGINNLMEYVFGTSPTQANKSPAMPMELVTSGSDKFLQVTIPRRIDHTAKLTVEVSSDLVNWYSGTSKTVTVSDSPAGLVVRDLEPHSPDRPKRFVRVKAESP